MWRSARGRESPTPVASVPEALEPGGGFDDFFRAEMPRLVMLARTLSGSAHADDLAQEAMLAAFLQWDRISHYDSPAGWVRRVCVNKAASAARRSATEARTLLRLNAPTPPVPDTGDGTSAVLDAIRGLPRRQAQAVALFYVYGMDVAEIGQVLGCSQGTVKTHLWRGRAALAARLGEEGSDGS